MQRLSSIALIILLGSGDRLHAHYAETQESHMRAVSEKLGDSMALPKLPTTPVRHQVMLGAGGRTYPPFEQQLVEIEQLHQEAKATFSFARDAAMTAEKAKKFTELADARLSEAEGPVAEATGVVSLVDAVLAVVDWVMETIVRADKMKEVAEKAIGVAPPAESNLSPEKRRDLARRVMESWTGREAREWGTMLMDEATKVRSQSSDVGKENAKTLMRALSVGENAATELISLAAGTAAGIGRQAAAVQGAVRSMHTDNSAVEAAEAAAAAAAEALIAEEESGMTDAKAGSQKTGSKFRPQNQKQRAHAALFARSTGSGVSILALALIGLFTGSGITLTLLRFLPHRVIVVDRCR